MKLSLPISLLTCFLTLCSLSVQAAPVFDPVFQDNMVLQRDAPITIWGTAKPKSPVRISWQGEEIEVTPNAQGEWMVSFPPLAAKASPSTLTATDKEGSVTLKDILIGDVWLASGQSNMEYTMSRFTDGRKDYASFNIPELRFMKMHNSLPTGGVSYSIEGYEKAKEKGFFSFTWQHCTPKNTRLFSATAAYFARALQAELDIPVGIICNAVGGVGMESWLPKKVIDKNRDLRALRGDKWMTAPADEFSPWMAGRGKLNLQHLLAAGEKDLQHPFRPSSLYEHALRPLLRLPIRGVIWYQGESNAEIKDMERNRMLMRLLVSSWRASFKNAKLPFYMVQLPRIKDAAPLRAHWAQFRETQQRFADETNGVELICTLDLGMRNADVHPSPKRPVGERLSALALHHSYQKKDQAAAGVSPRILSATWEKNKVMLKLSAPVITLDGQAAQGFTYAARKGAHYTPVTATLAGESIIVELPKPAQAGAEIRYNYSTFMEPNVVSEVGKLPLFPWRMKK